MNSLNNKMTGNFFKTVYNVAADLLCPRKCIVCNSLIDIGRKICVCNSCRKIIASQGKVYADDNVAYEEAICSLEYGKHVRDALIRYKFGGKYYLHTTFSTVIWEKIRDRKFMNDIDIITSVPLHPKRGRDYNQSLVIARDLGEYSGIEVTENLILKTKNLKPLSSMSYMSRRTFIKGSMDMNFRYDVYGKNILLIDDIFTTGSTAGECARILKMYGAAKIYVACICYVTYGENEEKIEEEGEMTGGYANLFDD